MITRPKLQATALAHLSLIHLPNAKEDSHASGEELVESEVIPTPSLNRHQGPSAPTKNPSHLLLIIYFTEKVLPDLEVEREL